MAGSGLKELLMTIYAPNSLDKMLKGHAYARALRAHILTHLVLSKIVFQNIEFIEEERGEMSIILDDIDRSRILTAESNTFFKAVAEKFEKQLIQLEKNGPTAKLWIQYLRMVTLVKQFVEAERMGNWELHLATIQKMLPFFHASGHFNYAKSSHLYLQDMLQLREKMAPAEYKAFTCQGYFTIRRTSKFWSGTWSDMCIEQELMRSIKIKGGMTERGKTSSVSTKWTMGAVYL
ncbi:hypothetical protein ALC62_06362 [Cyphomyrmex costatus]|uniref:Uncharacterized protein n=1 Tax=Cyphomyrmex costatus TaxID=456900 RepID=A0A195CRP5_9HYME|nr:hypothetical protein ALC62_06362 [Cyphomyrmex costatus]